MFGVSEDAYVWMLPTQDAATTHKRALGSRKVCHWVLDWLWSTVPSMADKRKPVLFNGVTDEAPGIQKWLKKAVGARFAPETVPSRQNGHPIRPFFLVHSAGYV